MSIVNDIKTGINQALDEEFIGITIYCEEVKQGFEEPCFSVFCLNPTNELFLNKRYFRTNLFCIKYFPKETESKNDECNDVLEKLYDCLELINVSGDLVRGTKMKGEVVDEVLNFFLHYDMFVYKDEIKDKMEILKVNTDTKG